MKLDKLTYGVKNLATPPSKHGGYAVVVDGVVTGNYKYYDVARKHVDGGIVVPFSRVRNCGYKDQVNR